MARTDTAPPPGTAQQTAPVAAVPRGHRTSGDRRRARTGVLLTLPALLVLAVTVLYPILWTVSLSLQSFSLAVGAEPPRFVGLENYQRILGSEAFRAAMGHTLAFVATSLVVELLIAFPLALALHRAWRGAKAMQLVIALPLMVAPVVASMAFQFLFSDGYGLINHTLSLVGISPPSWFADVWLARTTVLVTNLWLAVPFDVLVLLAGLAAVPAEPLEAATMDGANRWQAFRHIVLPMLRPAVLIILVIRLADAFRVFDAVYVLTGGGPGGSTEVMSTYLYRQLFTVVDFAGGSAASILFVLVMAISAAAVFVLLRPRKEA
ncbi:carbohydrate ABC transporter permease [Pseudonocardia sp. MH-G8]|uniref:carbohydrate ABC transporter permease n=1 Tax=Pseudonocardia sp. MH-G8 TaxID=1854588 RepID=UPI000B9FFC6E|nr:sugar ABC transporter permease [Pseudonocardia sp. MH-G8]OZM75777.1 ABC transporter permease [Pseudonocardia sp. MH-G8]